VASALGITALLTASQVAYDVLRWAGAAYLCFLGVRALWRNRRPSTVDSAELTVVKSGVGRAFRTGLATDLLNPKVGVFYLSVLPQFLPRGVSPLLASTAMAVLHDIEGLLWFAGLVFLIGRGARLLSRPGVQRRLDQLAGLVFIGFGLRLAAEGARRQS
jgi:threonine/homoserine/homoserine lactone efflux protein